MHNNTKLLATALVTSASLLTVGTALSHHSITGEFDTESTIEIGGTLTKLDWANPHLWYYLDVTNAAGEIEKWQCTTGINPNRLIRAGWKKEDLPIGSVVRFARANPARDKSNTCYVNGLTLEDGTPIFSGNRNAQN